MGTRAPGRRRDRGGRDQGVRGGSRNLLVHPRVRLLPVLLDRSAERHTLITYAHGPAGLVPTMVGPNPMQPPTRYLVPDDRDFFAVYRPLPGPVTVPFT
jgi:hypothetical protein